MVKFSATLEILGINPFVLIPLPILNEIFEQANKTKGAIPIKGTINGKPYQQNLVKYSGSWRLYLNMKMLKNSPRRIGETIEVVIEFDVSDRTIPPHPRLVDALKNNKPANKVFENLSPSSKKEIIRYISHLKTEESIDRNIERAIQYLLGNGSFVGRKNS